MAVDFIKSVLFSPLVVAIALIVGGLIIFWAESIKFDHKLRKPLKSPLNRRYWLVWLNVLP
jgi:undecaprenyl-diphosphatase